MTAIHNCKILFTAGEEISSELQKMNLFIGERAAAVIEALAYVCCGARSKNSGIRSAVIEVEHNGIRYSVASVFSSEGSTEVVKYPSDKATYNEAASAEFGYIRDGFAYDSRNIFKNDKISGMDDLLSDAEISVLNYGEFNRGLMGQREVRPIFISGFFEKIDKDARMRVLEELSASAPDSQFFIAVTRDVFGENFAGEKIFLEKTKISTKA